MFSMIGVVGMVTMALAWIGLVLLVIWSLGHVVPHERRSTEDMERDVLRHRYAAGEITESEYQYALHALGYDSVPGTDEGGLKIS